MHITHKQLPAKLPGMNKLGMRHDVKAWSAMYLNFFNTNIESTMQELLDGVVMSADVQKCLGTHSAVHAAIVEWFDAESLSVMQDALAEAAREENLTESEPYSTPREGPSYNFSQSSSQGCLIRDSASTPSNARKRSRLGDSPPELSQVSYVSQAESTTPANTLCSQLSCDPEELSVHEYDFPVPTNDPVKDLLGVTKRLPWEQKLPAKVSRARYRAGLKNVQEEVGDENEWPEGALDKVMRHHGAQHPSDSDESEDEADNESEEEEEEDKEEEEKDEGEADDDEEDSDDDFKPPGRQYIQH